MDGRRRLQRRTAVVISVLALLGAMLSMETGIAGAASARSAATTKRAKPKPKPKPTTTTTAGGSSPSATSTEEHRPEDAPEPLRCLAGRPDGAPMVWCQWRETDRPAFAAYQLWREVPGTPRQPVFKTSDPGSTVYLDHEVTEGTNYAYALEILGQDGKSLAHSNVVKLTCCAPNEPTKPPKGEGGNQPPPSGDGTKPPKGDRPPPQGDGPKPPPDAFRCAAGHKDGAPAAYCKWRANDNPAFGSYRLWREVQGSARQVIFTSQDRGTTLYLDNTVADGTNYAYALEILDKDGKTIGHSEVFKVHCCDSEQPKPSTTTTSRPAETTTTTRPPETTTTTAAP